MAQIEKRPAPVTVSGAFVVSRVCAVKIFQRIKKFEKLIAATATVIAPSFALHFVVAGRVPAYFALVAAEQAFWRAPDCYPGCFGKLTCESPRSSQASRWIPENSSCARNHTSAAKLPLEL